MIEFYAKFTHGIPTVGATPSTAPYAMICGEIRIEGTSTGTAPYTYKLVKGKGDTHNYLFSLGPVQPGYCYVMTVAPWDSTKPQTIAEVSIRVMVKDATGAQRTKILKFV